jgi:hypothetical protein
MIRLVPLDEPRTEELLRDPEGGLREMVSNGPKVKALLQQSLAFHRRVGSREPWHGYLAVDVAGVVADPEGGNVRRWEIARP